MVQERSPGPFYLCPAMPNTLLLELATRAEKERILPGLEASDTVRDAALAHEIIWLRDCNVRLTSNQSFSRRQETCTAHLVYTQKKSAKLGVFQTMHHIRPSGESRRQEPSMAHTSFSGAGVKCTEAR